tara:strand:+ start:4579 stop:5523 length:945 start_codon:yes stop_codon:yes gene_type:complete
LRTVVRLFLIVKVKEYIIVHNNISIIFVVYKSGQILFKNIKNLKNYEIIIIDNDKDSNIKNEILRINKSIKYFKMNKNLGIAKAANFAFRKINNEFVLYLSADTIITHDNILRLKNIFDKYINIGIVAPMHQNTKGEYLGNYFCHPINRIIKRTLPQKKIYSSLSKIRPSGDFSVKCVWGAPILIKSSLINKIGFFDNNYFMYFEDTDLCDRVITSGHEIIETSDSYCTHYKAISSSNSLRYAFRTMTAFKFSELYYFSKYERKYVIRIYIHLFDYLFRFVINIFLLNKKKVYTNLFRIIGILKFLFYQKKTKF